MNAEAGLAVMTALAVAVLLTHKVAIRSRAAAPVWASFCLHILVSFTIYNFQRLSGDALSYDEAAQGYVAFWSHHMGTPPTFALGKEGWILILAGIYYTAGHIPLLGLIVNAIASAMTTSLIMGSTARLGRPDMAKLAGWLCLLPPFLYWGSLLLREALAWLLTAAMLWAALGIVTKVGRLNVAVVSSALVGMLWIRGTAALVLTVGIAVAIVVSARRIPNVLLAGTVGVGAIGGPLLARALSLASTGAIDRVNASRTDLSRAGSGFDTINYTDAVSLVRSLPSASARAIFGPYPWELRDLPVTAVVDLAAWLFLLVLVYRGWRRHSRMRFMCLIPALFLLMTIGATSGNYGTLVRLRVQTAVLLLPLAAVGWRRLRDDADIMELDRPVRTPRRVNRNE
ncbi:MAG: hypothetical protein ACR2P2_04175 [Nakamurella sp.]